MDNINSDINTDKLTQHPVPKIIYVLYLLGLFSLFPGVIGVILAYIYKDESPEWIQTHLQFQIRTFWIGALFIIPGFILSFVLIGIPILLLWGLWLAVRCANGLKLMLEEKPYPNPTSWLI